MTVLTDGFLFLIGMMFGSLVISIAFFMYIQKKSWDKMPHLLLLNPISEELYNTGRMAGLQQKVTLPFLKGKKEYYTWGFLMDNYYSYGTYQKIKVKLKINTEIKNSARIILPTGGNMEEMVIKSEYVKAIKILKGRLIGTARNEKKKKEIIEEWVKLFLEAHNITEKIEIDYDAIPNNYIFIQPINYNTEFFDSTYKKASQIISNANKELIALKGALLT